MRTQRISVSPRTPQFMAFFPPIEASIAQDGLVKMDCEPDLEPESDVGSRLTAGAYLHQLAGDDPEDAIDIFERAS